MTKEGEKIHAFWYCLVAMKVVLGKMSKAKAEREAYDFIVEKYGEERLRKEFEL
jgi:hypothetical protein